jgi:hypothetical protein
VGTHVFRRIYCLHLHRRPPSSQDARCCIPADHNTVMNSYTRKIPKSHYTKPETALSYDRVNAIFTRCSTAYIITISTHNPSGDQFVYVAAPQENYKTHIYFRELHTFLSANHDTAMPTEELAPPDYFIKIDISCITTCKNNFKSLTHKPSALDMTDISCLVTKCV